METSRWAYEDDDPRKPANIVQQTALLNVEREQFAALQVDLLLNRQQRQVYRLQAGSARVQALLDDDNEEEGDNDGD